MKPIFLRTKLLSHYRASLLANALGLTEGTEDRQDTPAFASGELHTPSDQTAVITTTHDSALAYGKELIHALSGNLRRSEFSEELDTIWEFLRYHIRVVHVANHALTKASATVPVTSPKRDPSVPEYLLSARFVAECSDYLLADPNGWERLHLVKGLALEGNRFTLSEMNKVPMSHQSHTGAKADQHAFTRAMIELSAWGEALIGLFHNHPGTGVRATLPSLDKDIPTHQRLETGGYPVVGAIFVPGYVRFFSAEKPFTVTIYGSGVSPVPGETHVYQIQNPSLPRHVSVE